MEQQAVSDAEIIAEIRTLVSNDRLEDALQKLAHLEKCKQEALLLTQQLTHNSREGRLGTLTAEDIRVERTRIAAAILECTKLDAQTSPVSNNGADQTQVLTASDVRKKRRWAADFAQWVSRRRRFLGRSTVVVFLSWLILALIGNLPPFYQRAIWAPTPAALADAQTLFSNGNILLVGGQNLSPGCAHHEKGLWLSDDHGNTWHNLNVPVEFPDANNCQFLAAIVGIAASPTQPQRVYAATDAVGVLRSDKANSDKTGDSWQRLTQSNADLNKLKGIVVDQQNEGVLVAAQGAGLYRSDDQGTTWQRLDQKAASGPNCETGAPFTKTLSVGVLYSTVSAIIVGTGDPDQLTPAHVPVGLYMSTDGGECWQLLHTGGDRYEYLQVADASSTTRKSLLFVSKDWKKHDQPDSLGLWQMDLAPQRTPPRLLWKHRHGVAALIVTGRDDQLRWYVATVFGLIYQGVLDSSRTVRLPWITRCLLMIPCEMAFAPDPGADGQTRPLLLAANRVYRLALGPWWRLIWS